MGWPGKTSIPPISHLLTHVQHDNRLCTHACTPPFQDIRLLHVHLHDKLTLMYAQLSTSQPTSLRLHMKPGINRS
jgi:hypothetical protein